ncbi:MAG: prepilin-type N-terminal cleavage/methylation domain-containing protein [Sedimentisphaerales bacterium]|nr:prepilin-type N-terminal cleavage/methylation domain-containing protein [Sedimentisphaerales bacterium]
MDGKKRQSGFTLVEMLVVVSIVAVLAALVLPNTMGIIRSHRAAATKNLIKNAMAQAKAHAAVTQKYAGVRFQFTKDQWQNNRQYLVLIENEPGIVLGLSSQYQKRFITVRNAKAAALPVGMGVISIRDFEEALFNLGGVVPDDNTIDGIKGITTFSIIFSPTGQLVSKDVCLVPRDDLDELNNIILDTIINDMDTVDSGDALLYCDNTEIPGSWLTQGWCVKEFSALGLYIFDADKLMSIDGLNMSPDDRAVERAIYIQSLEPILINIYTGTIIREEL